MKALTGTLVEAEGELFEAEGCLKAMESEILTLPKKRYDNIITKCRDEYEIALRAVERLKVVVKSASIRGGTSFMNWSMKQTAKQSVEEPLSSLQQSKLILSETEHIGSVILSDLRGNRELLLGAKDNVGGTNESAQQAGEVLQIMDNRIENKSIFLLFLIVMLLIAISFIAYFGLLKRRNPFHIWSI